MDATAEEIDRLKFEINRAAEHVGESISLDELDAVAGGALWDYSYEKSGCVSTVEYQSSCWGDDGGCDLMHNNYVRGPVNVLCTCGHYMFKYGLEREADSLQGVLKCPYCNRTLEVDVRVFSGLETSR